MKMKRTLIGFIALIALVVAACAPVAAPTEAPAEEPTATAVPEAEAPATTVPEEEPVATAVPTEEPAEEAGAMSTTLTAVKADAVSLDADAAYWADAPSITLPSVAVRDDLPDGPEVTLQAAYDGTSLAIRAEWADETESIYKDAWTWDGIAFAKSGDEDHLNFAWPINMDPQFPQRGCGQLCHEMTVDGQTRYRMGAPSEDLPYDAWNWKATRTNPVGQADDQNWQVLTETERGLVGRRDDASDGGGPTPNITEDESGPAFMHGTDPDSPVIRRGEEVPIDPTQLAAGAMVPGYIVDTLTGSRGDIVANGQWSDGKWVVVLLRALETGNEDDVQLTPGTPQYFGLSVTDEGSGSMHKAVPVPLTLAWAE